MPAPLVAAVLAFLPADARARAAAVSRVWRTASSDPEAWLEADLTRVGGVTCGADLNPTGLLAVLAPRLVRTRVLALQPTAGPDGLEATLRCVLRLVREGGLSALRELRFHGSLIVRVPGVPSCLQALRELLADARALNVVDMQLVAGDSAAAVALLPFRPRVRVRHFSWTGRFDQEGPPAVTSAQVLEQLERHEWLRALTVTDLRAGYAPPALLPRLVDFVLARHLERVAFRGLGGGEGGEPHVAQLVRLVRDSTTLRALFVTHPFTATEFYDVANLLPEALHGNTTLRELELNNADVWLRSSHGPPRVPLHWNQAEALFSSNALRSRNPTKLGHELGAKLFCALAGHPFLESLSFRCLEPALGTYADESLAALLDADAPALTTLRVQFAAVDFRGHHLPMTFAALARNTHLRKLELRTIHADLRTVHDIILPSVRANGSLRHLRLIGHGRPSADALAAIAEAEQLVAARNL